MNETPSDQSDCGCDNNECCPPKKKKPSWLRILSVLILLIALSIIFIKVFDKNSSAKASVKEEAAIRSSCCDTTKQDSTVKSCCPEK